jgi:hypothetical protein
MYCQRVFLNFLIINTGRVKPNTTVLFDFTVPVFITVQRATGMTHLVYNCTEGNGDDSLSL